MRLWLALVGAGALLMGGVALGIGGAGEVLSEAILEAQALRRRNLADHAFELAVQAECRSAAGWDLGCIKRLRRERLTAGVNRGGR